MTVQAVVDMSTWVWTIVDWCGAAALHNTLSHRHQLQSRWLHRDGVCRLRCRLVCAADDKIYTVPCLSVYIVHARVQILLGICPTGMAATAPAIDTHRRAVEGGWKDIYDTGASVIPIPPATSSNILSHTWLLFGGAAASQRLHAVAHLCQDVDLSVAAAVCILRAVQVGLGHGLC